MNPTNGNDVKTKALQSALAEISKLFGSEAVQAPGDHHRRKKIEAIPTGSLALDIALGIGGIPKGRIIEIYGPESAGKTTLVYEIIAQAQKAGGTCAFIDAEHAMDMSYAQNIGVDFDNLYVSQPDYGEQALEIADKFVRSGAMDLIAIDSVAALTPKSELEGAMGDQTVGLQARMMSQAMRKLSSGCNQTDTTIVFINQIREKIGVMFGSPETQPGGRALKFFSSVRMDIRRTGTEKDGTEAIGNSTKVKIVKNKVAPPYREALFTIIFGEGIDGYGQLLDYAVDSNSVVPGIVSKSGSFYTFEDTGDKAQGVAKARAYLAEHPEIAEKIYNGVAAALLPQEVEEQPEEEMPAEIAADLEDEEATAA